MKLHARLAVALATATAATMGITAPGAGAGGSPAHGLPRYVFAPYFETYDTSAPGPAALSKQSGSGYLSLAFLQTAETGSCTVYWNGTETEPVSQTSLGRDISAIQAAGGNVIPSFGGYSADSTGTDIADSCTTVSAIAHVYEDVITTYNVPRIDLDVEATSVTDIPGIIRRNEAIAKVEAWAAHRGRSIQFSYTLSATPTGLPQAELSILKNAVAEHARISTVNLMTFDYYIGTKQNMLADTETAAAAFVAQLEPLYPSMPSWQLWQMVGVIEMPGIDTFGPDETFSKADAIGLLAWAYRTGIGTLSFWALQRDNGGCPGTAGSTTCSGIAQPPWYFSHVFELFTR